MPEQITSYNNAETQDCYVTMDWTDRQRVRNDPFFHLSQKELAARHGMVTPPVHVLMENGKPCDKWTTPAA